MNQDKPLLPIELIFQLLGICSQASRFKLNNKSPTTDSIAHIQAVTGVTIPELYIRYASETPNGLDLWTLGDDFDERGHILCQNRYWHEEDGLPEKYIIFNSGHDGDCYCWDREEKSLDCEQCIYHVSVGEDRCTVLGVSKIANNFYEFLGSELPSMIEYLEYSDNNEPILQAKRMLNSWLESQALDIQLAKQDQP
ncbi:MAG TPA: SMI1/KNR4 family protein [Gemmatales bacterium]|nr:SMI1/KNR4 family protein [Gemmatales bacterium]